MVKSIRVIVLALLAFAALLALGACDSGGSSTPAAVPRPTATTEAVQPHRLRPVATPTADVANPQPTVDTQAQAPTAVPTQDFGITYTNYTGKSGTWSIDYPNTWQVLEQDPNVQFVEPKQAAFIQVTTSPMDPSKTNKDLAQIASDQFALAFGASYKEQNRELQNDGSYRVDFTFNPGDADWAGQVFVEGRQSNLYMLLLATSQAQAQSDLYQSIFTHVIDSYILPSK
jgi:hypothetical protein